MPKFPARVHPILARKANTAVIIRRGLTHVADVARAVELALHWPVPARPS